MFQPEKECRSRTTSPIRITRARQSLFELPVAKPQRRRQVQLQSLPRAERPKHNPASLDRRVAPEKAENTRLLPVGILARWLEPESRTMPVQPPTRRRSGENRSCNEARSEDRAAGWLPFCRASLSYYRQFLTANSSM